MNDVIDALTGAVADACARHTTDPDTPAELNAPLWEALDQIGVLGLGVDEEKGGSGGGLEELVAVLGVLGENAAAVPFAETGLAAWILAEAGVQVPEGRLTVAVSDGLEVVTGTDGTVEVSATLPRVPWGEAAEHVVVLSGTTLAVVARDQYQVTSAQNMAGEPRDTLVLAGARPVGGQTWPVPAGLTQAHEQRLSVLRMAQMAGAARRALDLSVHYASERQQFGRSIDRFQSVQHQLASLASEVLVCRTAAKSASLALTRGDATFALAAARVAAAQAAGVVAKLAHQVHGAIGFTEEHTLRLSTTRLWAWRDENGSVHQHASLVGQQALDAGPDSLWDLLVRA